jgi:ABC-type multidrug transport system fused ATPase/permease subunit
MSQNASKQYFKKGLYGLKRHFLPFKKDLILISVFGLFVSIFNGVIPYITGRFFDELIILSNGQMNHFYTLPLWLAIIILWLLIQIFANLFDWLIDFNSAKINSKTHLHLTYNGFRKLFRLPISFHKNEKVSQMLDRISMAGWRSSALVRQIINISPQIFSFLIGFVLALTINKTLALIMIGGVLLYLLTLKKILKEVVRIDEESHTVWNEIWGNTASAALQIDSVKQSSAESYEEEKMRKGFLQDTFDKWIALDKIWINIGFFQRVIIVITQLTIFILSINFIINGQITVGELIALNAYTAMFFGPFVTLGHSWQNIQNGITTLGQAEDLFCREEEKYIPENAISNNQMIGEIKFENVSFQYENDHPVVLNNINFETRKGELIALVGESGGGKSTLISLISAYYFPTKGRVLIDGVNTKNYDLNFLRSKIAVVPQEVALFNDTIKNNIRYGNLSADDELVVMVAKQAHIDEFIDTLPDKYETLVGERGIKLSVGQKQRLAIARAILRNPAILILDEPTSALDAKTEQFINESLEKIMKGRTTFVIAHRLSTVRKADIILVFDKGEIVEKGKHSELIKIENGIYKRLHDYQIGLS